MKEAEICTKTRDPRHLILDNGEKHDLDCVPEKRFGEPLSSMARGCRHLPNAAHGDNFIVPVHLTTENANTRDYLIEITQLYKN